MRHFLDARLVDVVALARSKSSEERDLCSSYTDVLQEQVIDLHFLSASFTGPDLFLSFSSTLSGFSSEFFNRRRASLSSLNALYTSSTANVSTLQRMLSATPPYASV